MSVGLTVREAETLLTLVPLGGNLEVESEVRADDIGKVHEGDSVRVKITAFPFQKYGTLDGKVRVVSEEACQNQQDCHMLLSRNGKACRHGALVTR